MSEPFLAEIRMVGFNFAPRGWAFCDGQILPINQNQALYSLLGTTYGGDGRTSFALPDLRGRTPIHQGNGHTLGQSSGEEGHTLAVNEMPNHTHSVQANNANDANNTGTVPNGRYFGQAITGESAYVAFQQAVSLSSITANGGGQAHDNMQPYLALNFCIALQGLFPSRN